MPSILAPDLVSHAFPSRLADLAFSVGLPRGFAVLDVAGHNLQFERPELFGALVRDWLDRVAGEPRS